jgi:PilZ domain-containing protein
MGLDQGERYRAQCECQVMDISKNGAKVMAAMPAVVPDRFELAFSEGGQTRVCEVVWRRAKMLGVKFVSTTALPSQ